MWPLDCIVNDSPRLLGLSASQESRVADPTAYPAELRLHFQILTLSKLVFWQCIAWTTVLNRRNDWKSMCLYLSLYHSENLTIAICLVNEKGCSLVHPWSETETISFSNLFGVMFVNLWSDYFFSHFRSGDDLKTVEMAIWGIPKTWGCENRPFWFMTLQTRYSLTRPTVEEYYIIWPVSIQNIST